MLNKAGNAIAASQRIVFHFSRLFFWQLFMRCVFVVVVRFADRVELNVKVGAILFA